MRRARWPLAVLLCILIAHLVAPGFTYAHPVPLGSVPTDTATPTAPPTPPPAPTPIGITDPGATSGPCPSGSWDLNILGHHCLDPFGILGDALHNLAVLLVQMEAQILSGVLGFITTVYDPTAGGPFQPLDDLFVQVWQAAWILLSVGLMATTIHVLMHYPFSHPSRMIFLVGGPFVRVSLYELALYWGLHAVFEVLGLVSAVLNAGGVSTLSHDIVASVVQQGDAASQIIVSIIDVVFGLAFLLITILILKEALIGLFMVVFLFVISPLCICSKMFPAPLSNIASWWTSHFFGFALYPLTIAAAMDVDIKLLFALPHAGAGVGDILIQRALGLVGLLFILRALALTSNILGGTSVANLKLPSPMSLFH